MIDTVEGQWVKLFCISEYPISLYINFINGNTWYNVYKNGKLFV